MLRLGLALLVCAQLQAQTLFNVDFGVGTRSAKMGFAATGQGTNDFWNLYRHYDPKFVPGSRLVPNGVLKDLKLADGTPTKVAVVVNNAPGVWGNASGDPMYDSYIFSQNGSNITVSVKDLEPGRYHFYFYGHADPDAGAEQNSSFRMRSGTNTFGPLATLGAVGWKAVSPWQERYQYIVFRDVPVVEGHPVTIDVLPGANGLAVLNGMQIISRGTSPPRLLPVAAAPPPTTFHNLIFHEIRYDGKVSDTEARFSVDLRVESLTTNEISGTLFEGDVAVVAPMIPEGLHIVSSAKKYRVVARAPGTYDLKLELVAKINREEPWNHISFVGPSAAIASVSARTSEAGVEMQLLSGTPQDVGTKAASSIQGLLGADRKLSLRWQTKAAEVVRRSLVTVETLGTAQIMPTVIKFTTQLHYEILQAAVPALTVSLPISHTLTKVQGDHIRDWNVTVDGGRQLLKVEFIKPAEKSCALTLFSEQALENSPLTAQLALPQPLDIQRESGSLSITTDDMLVEIQNAVGLRQVNAATGTLATYRFHSRPSTLAARLKRVEPVLRTADRVTARLEETRLLVTHAMALTVERAGVYSVEMTPPADFVVVDVNGDGVEDWNVAAGRLRVNFSNRVLGTRQLAVQLEQRLKVLPDRLTVTALRVALATNETAQIGAASALGIRLKTAGALSGLREIPIDSLSARSDELLAYAAEQADWQLSLAAEKLSPRIVADVFNLMTIGDGLVGGSATIRFGLINQGVQQFEVKLPAHWKNVEFTGPNIRRKEIALPAPGSSTDTNYVVWNLALQDKAWSGYPLVVTYDYQFDPRMATLDLRSAHARNVERETGSLAITIAASLKLEPQPVSGSLRLIDQMELAESDRALITRPVLLTYNYVGDGFELRANVARQDELRLLDAVADRTQITSVLTKDGQMLTQASFMVKNNDRQFQKFRLPKGAKLWGCDVNNEPVKGELDGDWLLVSLPRRANRDEAFAVDIKYEQKLVVLQARFLPQSFELTAPQTDVPNTYAEWQLFAPPTQRLSGFGGSMTIARGTTYEFRDGWHQFTEFYAGKLRDYGDNLIVFGGLALFIVSLLTAAIRRGFGGLVTVLVVFSILAIFAGMLLPALAKSKARAHRINTVSTLKQVGLAARIFANEHGDRLPISFEEMTNELVSERILFDIETGQRLIYAGAGKNAGDPHAIIAYAPNGRAICFADGSVEQTDAAQFAAALQRDAIAASEFAASQSVAIQNQLVREQQIRTLPPLAGTAPAQVTEKQGKTMDLLSAAAPGSIAAGGRAGPAVSSGVRSIRIEIPRAGHAFTFTKVLHANDEPLTIRLSAMEMRWFLIRRMFLQLACFLTGLTLLWIHWHRSPRQSFWLAVGLGLTLGAFGSLLIAVRALHLAFIVSAPVAGTIFVVWLAIRLLPRVFPPASRPSPVSGGASGPESGAASVAVMIALTSTLAHLVVPRVSGQEAFESNDRQRPDTNTVSIISASYTGNVHEKVAQFDATLRLDVLATNQTVALFGDDVAVQQFSANNRHVKLLRQGNMIALQLVESGSAIVQVRLLVKLGGDETKHQLGFGIPVALASQLAMIIDEPEADVEFPTAVSFQRTSDRNATRVAALMGSGDRVDLIWTPRVKRVAEMAASIFAQNTTLATVGGGVINTRTTIEYQVTQGAMRQLKVRLPAGQRLLRVEGEFMRTWELGQEGNDEILTVDLVKSVSPAYRLTVETEKALEALPARVRIETAHAMEVIRETGLLGLRAGEESSLSVDGVQDLQRVDVAEFTKAGMREGDAVLSAYRFLKTDFELVAHAEPTQPQVEAIARNSVHVGFNQVRVSAQVDYVISKAGIFSLKLAVPNGYIVGSVRGTNVQQWSEKGDAHELEVALKERVLGPFTLLIELTKTHKELPKTIEVLGVRPLATQKLGGFVAVSAEPGMALRGVAFDGLVEVAGASLGKIRSAADTTSVLAYRFLGTDPQTAVPWKLVVSTELVDAWVRADVANIVTVGETLVSGRTVLRYDIQNSPAKEFRVKIPATLRNVELVGLDIRRRDQFGEEWRIELQNKVRGIYTLVATWEQPRDARTNAPIVVPAIGAVGVERETGVVALLAQPPIQVTEQSAGESLARIDARELPDWAGIAAGGPPAHAEVPVLIYRYRRPDYQLAVAIRRFEEAAVLQGLVDSAQLTTVVADDGQMMTEMKLTVRNNGLQYLKVELPPNNDVWSAFVAGLPVRPSRRAAQLLLPLEPSGTTLAPATVELTFVGREQFPKTKGEIKLVSPKLDIPVKNARWDLFLPPEFDYSKFAGTMSRVADDVPDLRVYSSLEYFRQESEKKIARQSEVKGILSSARQGLSAGKVKSAGEEFNQAMRLNADADAATKAELDDLKKELGRAQSSNLIQAQRAYTFENTRRYADPQTLPARDGRTGDKAAELLQYDADIAGQQWGALLRAQEVTVVHLQPLRVNLPLRGQRHSFSQVLQTEVNKPMTIQFAATSTKELGWLKRIGFLAGGFLMLWLLMALAANRVTRKPELTPVI